MAVVTSIMRVQQIFLGRVDSTLKPFGLTFARFELLALLNFSKKGALPLAKASARLQVHPTSVTNAVNRLEQAGFVERVAHPTDGRATLVQITPKGRETVVAASLELNSQVFMETGFSDREISTLVTLLAKFRRHSGDFDENFRRDDY